MRRNGGGDIYCWLLLALGLFFFGKKAQRWHQCSGNKMVVKLVGWFLGGDKMVSLLRLFSWVTGGAFSNTQKVVNCYITNFGFTRFPSSFLLYSTNTKSWQ